MKKIVIIIIGVLTAGVFGVKTQVKIGEMSAPVAGTILDLNSSIKGGLLLSVVELTDLNSIPYDVNKPNIFPDYDPLEKDKLTGALVYNQRTDPDPMKKIVPGVYFWDGAKWIHLQCR